MAGVVLKDRKTVHRLQPSSQQVKVRAPWPINLDGMTACYCWICIRADDCHTATDLSNEVVPLSRFRHGMLVLRLMLFSVCVVHDENETIERRFDKHVVPRADFRVLYDSVVPLPHR